VAALLAKAEAADQVDVPAGMSIPKELARGEARLARLAEARAEIAERAKERFECGSATTFGPFRHPILTPVRMRKHQ
jgi:hypothetical protein